MLTSKPSCTVEPAKPSQNVAVPEMPFTEATGVAATPICAEFVTSLPQPSFTLK